MKILYFEHAGKYYRVNEKGCISNDNVEFSQDWLFLGVSFHHWRSGIDISLEEALKDPTAIVGGLVWDCDYGTVRTWGGQYSGKIPRITAAHVKEI